MPKPKCFLLGICLRWSGRSLHPFWGWQREVLVHRQDKTRNWEPLWCHGVARLLSASLIRTWYPKMMLKTPRNACKVCSCTSRPPPFPPFICTGGNYTSRSMKTANTTSKPSPTLLPWSLLSATLGLPVSYDELSKHNQDMEQDCHTCQKLQLFWKGDLMLPLCLSQGTGGRQRNLSRYYHTGQQPKR